MTYNKLKRRKIVFLHGPGGRARDIKLPGWGAESLDRRALETRRDTPSAGRQSHARDGNRRSRRYKISVWRNNIINFYIVPYCIYELYTIYYAMNF